MAPLQDPCGILESLAGSLQDPCEILKVVRKLYGIGRTCPETGRKLSGCLEIVRKVFGIVCKFVCSGRSQLWKDLQIFECIL